jgi:[ribosomal protein S5]-alanine N-acetyltransferase
LSPAEIPANWPPESTADALPLFLRWLGAAPDGVGWFGWYALAKEAGAQGPVLVGNGGFLGPPQGGVVDVGYSVRPQYHKRGIATEMVGRLLRWAFEESEELHRISAETEWSNFASVRVLMKLGFIQSGQSANMDEQRFGTVAGKVVNSEANGGTDRSVIRDAGRRQGSLTRPSPVTDCPEMTAAKQTLAPRRP